MKKGIIFLIVFCLGFAGLIAEGMDTLPANLVVYDVDSSESYICTLSTITFVDNFVYTVVPLLGGGNGILLVNMNYGSFILTIFEDDTWWPHSKIGFIAKPCTTYNASSSVGQWTGTLCVGYAPPAPPKSSHPARKK